MGRSEHWELPREAQAHPRQLHGTAQTAQHREPRMQPRGMDHCWLGSTKLLSVTEDVEES